MFAINKAKYEHVAVQTNKQIAIKEYYLYDDGYIVSSKPSNHSNCYSKIDNIPHSRTFCISIKDVNIFNKEDQDALLNKVNDDIRQANEYHLNKKTKSYQAIPEMQSFSELQEGMRIQLQTAQDGKNQDTSFIDFASYVRNLEQQQRHSKYKIAQKTIPEQKQCIFVTYMGSDFATAFHIMQLKLLFLHARKQFTTMTKQLVQGRDVYVRKFHFVNNFFGLTKVAGNKLRIGQNVFQFFSSDQSRIIGNFIINIDILIPDQSIDPVTFYQVYFMKKFDRIISQKKRSAQTQTYNLMTPEGNIIELEE